MLALNWSGIRLADLTLGRASLYPAGHHLFLLTILIVARIGLLLAVLRMLAARSKAASAIVLQLNCLRKHLDRQADNRPGDMFEQRSLVLNPRRRQRRRDKAKT